MVQSPSSRPASSPRVVQRGLAKVEPREGAAVSAPRARHLVTPRSEFERKITSFNRMNEFSGDFNAILIGLNGILMGFERVLIGS